jgi:RNA polymerase sigma factor (sigma-70 family)
MSEIAEPLREALLRHDNTGLTDGQLLECFLSRRDEAAVAALVRRHGLMVWGVCRRVVLNHHDAEDAFQAAFLVLVRKAATVLPRERVANWLYGVAYQTARKARENAARRGRRERQVADMPEPVVTDADAGRDLRPLLDEELHRLPEKYRAAIVLCDLEGKTRKAAALQMGVPEGTLSGRLDRGRALLARRLARHGLAPTAVALAALAPDAASAAVPGQVVSSTIRAATLVAAGQAAGAVSAPVAALTEGVLQTMRLTKLKSVPAVLLLTLVLGGGVVYLHQAPAAAQTAPAPAASGSPAEPEPPRAQPQQQEGSHNFLHAHLRQLHDFLWSLFHGQ